VQSLLEKINFMHIQQTLAVNNLSEKQSGKGSNPDVHGLKSHLQQLLLWLIEVRLLVVRIHGSGILIYSDLN
jgi:hypothetical protein